MSAVDFCLDLGERQRPIDERRRQRLAPESEAARDIRIARRDRVVARRRRHALDARIARGVTSRPKYADRSRNANDAALIVAGGIEVGLAKIAAVSAARAGRPLTLAGGV